MWNLDAIQETLNLWNATPSCYRLHNTPLHQLLHAQQHPLHAHTNTQPFYGHFSGTTQVSQCQRNPYGLYGATEDNAGRRTDNLAGCHSIRTNQRHTSIIPPIFMPDILPAATIPIYPSFGQAPNMLACIPSGLIQEYKKINK